MNDQRTLTPYGLLRRGLVAAMSAACALGLAWAPAAAQSVLDKEQADAVIAAFYTALFSRDSAEAARILETITTPDWRNCSDYDKCLTREQSLQAWAASTNLVPDKRWELVETFFSPDRVVVLGRFSGTPTGSFLGVDGGGRSFSINTADIHQVVDGKIVRTIHVENFGLAIRQLSDQS